MGRFLCLIGLHRWYARSRRDDIDPWITYVYDAACTRCGKVHPHDDAR